MVLGFSAQLHVIQRASPGRINHRRNATSRIAIQVRQWVEQHGMGMRTGKIEAVECGG